MFGLPAWGIAISAALLGGGMVYLFWKKLKAGDDARAEADTLKSYVKGDQDASATEAKISDALKKVDDEKPNGPLDWK